MAYSPEVRKQARKLGIKLPTGAVDTTPLEWSSDGYETLFEGPCKLDFVQGGWMVSLRRSGRKGGYRRVARDLSLEQAVELAHFLAKPANRRAYRGLAPKERKVAVPQANEHLTTDTKAALKELLGSVNGGAVKVS